MVLTGGMGGMGGAQPLAATMNGAAILCVEVDPARIARRLQTGYCDVRAESLDEALRLVEDARQSRRALSVALCANCADVLPELVRRGVTPDLVTDQTSAHDPLNGYIPRDTTSARRRGCELRIRKDTWSARWIRSRATSRRCSR